MNSSFRSYWRLSRSPRYSLTFVFPLLVLYELMAFLLSHDAIAGVRNGADVLLKSLFISLGGRDGLVAFGIVLVGSGAWLIWRDWRRAGGGLRPGVFGMMLAESVAYALLLGLVVGSLTSVLLGWLPRLAVGALGRFDLPTQLMISLGAGIYEELLFRVLLVSGLALLARRVFRWRPLPAGIFAALVGALIFSGFHYIGPYGDPFTLGSFVFRAIAGVAFSALYLTRGFGITAWSHALYDVLVAVR